MLPNLTRPISLLYIQPTAAKSVVGFSELKDTAKGAHAPMLTRLGAFFVPDVSCYGSARWSPSRGEFGILWRRLANPARASAPIFSEIWRKLLHTTAKGTAMSDTSPVLVVRPDAPTDSLHDVSRSQASQIHALAYAMGELLHDKDDLQQSEHFVHANFLTALMQDLCEQHVAVLQRLEGGV